MGMPSCPWMPASSDRDEKHGRIAKAIQDKGQVMSMTGDGANHAPSFKAVNVDIAAGR